MAPPPPPASATYAEEEGKRTAPPPSNSVTASPMINIILRVLTFVFLLVSLIIITTNTFTIAGYYIDVKFHFNDFYAYRYMLFTIIAGIVYSLLQAAFAIYHLSMGKPLSPGLYTFDFYADKVISYTLATGAAAAFGVTVDMKGLQGDDSGVHNFLNKANASASLLLIAFVFSAISSIFSSLALLKKP